MALENAPYINSLNEDWPEGLDELNTADDHIRLLKASIKRTFPNITLPVTASDVELNYVDGVTSNIQTQIDDLDAAKLGILGKAVNSFGADSATYAVSATRAVSAGYATSAGYAVSATRAVTAGYAISAGAAATAAFATTATTATNATTAAVATDYNNAVSAGQIPTLAGTKTDAATSTARGTVELATIAEALAGTDATRAVTPDSLASTLSLSNPGYYVFPGGLTLQWGAATFSTATTNQTAVADTFPRTFTSVLKVIIGQSSTDAVGSDYTCFVSLDEDTITTTGFNTWFQKQQAAGTFLANWIAIGIS